mgnify:CR=1 FL=1
MRIRKSIFLLFLLLSYLPVLAQVEEAWVGRYSGLSNYWDETNALAVDDSGNVYVTGKSWDSVTRYDYATIKYSPMGILCGLDIIMEQGIVMMNQSL